MAHALVAIPLPEMMMPRPHPPHRGEQTFGRPAPRCEICELFDVNENGAVSALSLAVFTPFRCSLPVWPIIKGPIVINPAPDVAPSELLMMFLYTPKDKCRE